MAAGLDRDKRMKKCLGGSVDETQGVICEAGRRGNLPG